MLSVRTPASDGNDAEPWWTSRTTHTLLLALLCFFVYCNNFRHEFQLDDSHVLTTNIAVRSLSNIPSFFTDPGTFTSLRANVDYRPIVQVSYAIDYWLGGYDSISWHLTSILLHTLCVLGLYAVCRRALLFGIGNTDRIVMAIVPLSAATLFAIHPTESGVVNYLSARSSLLAAVFVLPAIALYMNGRDTARSNREQWVPALLFALAIFTKVEAIACLAVFFLFDIWQTANASGHAGGFLMDMMRTINLRTLRRLWPTLVVAAIYFVIRHQLMGEFEFGSSRRAYGVSTLDYFLTQTVVWWHYVMKWFVPVGLVADEGNYPVYRSVFEPRVAIAIIGWIVIATFLLRSWRSRPWLLYFALSGLALLSPTSSVAPLAEMLNEHRPYLPLAILSLAWMIPLGMTAVSVARTRPVPRSLLLGMAAALMLCLSVLTLQRNRVFATSRSYLEDIVRKAPSGRALNNYGLIFLASGDYSRALDYLTQALSYTPRWHIVHTNLAIVYNVMGNSADAEKHFDLAVRFDEYSGTGLTWRAEYRLAKRDYRGAQEDLAAAVPRSLERYRLAKGLATSNAGLGNISASVEQTMRCLELDASQTSRDIAAIAKPFFDDAARAPEGLRYFEALDKVAPDKWWIQQNIGALAGVTGDSVRMRAALVRAATLKSGG